MKKLLKIEIIVIMLFIVLSILIETECSAIDISTLP